MVTVVIGVRLAVGGSIPALSISGGRWIALPKNAATETNTVGVWTGTPPVTGQTPTTFVTKTLWSEQKHLRHHSPDGGGFLSHQDYDLKQSELRWNSFFFC